MKLGIYLGPCESDEIDMTRTKFQVVLWIPKTAAWHGKQWQVFMPINLPSLLGDRFIKAFYNALYEDSKNYLLTRLKKVAAKDSAVSLSDDFIPAEVFEDQTLENIINDPLNGFKIMYDRPDALLGNQIAVLKTPEKRELPKSMTRAIVHAPVKKPVKRILKRSRGIQTDKLSPKKRNAKVQCRYECGRTY